VDTTTPSTPRSHQDAAVGIRAQDRVASKRGHKGGHYSGKIDGKLNARTMAAVRSFHKRR
jgi:hypothetical protein